MQVEQLVGYSVMTGVDILMISGLMVYTVQIDILEPCHGDIDKLSLQSGTEYARSCQASVVHDSWCDAEIACPPFKPQTSYTLYLLGGVTAFPEYQAEAVQHLHFANNAVRIGVLGSV